LPDQFPSRTYSELNIFFSHFDLVSKLDETLGTGFNNLEKGLDDIYLREIVKENVQILSNPLSINLLIEAVADPREFYDKKESVGDAVKYLNNFLRYDGYKLIYEGECYRVKEWKDGELVK